MLPEPGAVLTPMAKIRRSSSAPNVSQDKTTQPRVRKVVRKKNKAKAKAEASARKAEPPVENTPADPADDTLVPASIPETEPVEDQTDTNSGANPEGARVGAVNEPTAPPAVPPDQTEKVEESADRHGPSQEPARETTNMPDNENRKVAKKSAAKKPVRAMTVVKTEEGLVKKEEMATPNTRIAQPNTPTTAREKQAAVAAMTTDNLNRANTSQQMTPSPAVATPSPAQHPAAPKAAPPTGSTANLGSRGTPKTSPKNTANEDGDDDENDHDGDDDEDDGKNTPDEMEPAKPASRKRIRVKTQAQKALHARFMRFSRSIHSALVSEKLCGVHKSCMHSSMHTCTIVNKNSEIMHAAYIPNSTLNDTSYMISYIHMHACMCKMSSYIHVAWLLTHAFCICNYKTSWVARSFN